MRRRHPLARRAAPSSTSSRPLARRGRDRRGRERIVTDAHAAMRGNSTTDPGGVTVTETLRCRGWQQEAALRMLENNLHPDVAEKPEELVVYGGIGKAARNHACLAAIKRELTTLGDDETLLVQSGKPVAVFETHEAAPRVLIANSNLVGRWANWETFRELDAAGLMMYGQMTAGSWIYIGTQGILQGTYETFAAIGRPALRRHAARPARGHRRARRDGRRAAARGDDERGLRAVRRGRPAADRAADPRALPRRARRVARRRAGAARGGAEARAARSRSGCSATPPRCCPSSCGAARRSTSSPTRRARTTRSTATSPPA